MIGVITVRIHDSRNSYTFELKRKITILAGDSGRGKTTLFGMVEDYNRYGKASATKISCNCDMIALRGSNWKDQIEAIENSVIIIDEDSDYIRSKEFAETVLNSSNYFLLITRAYLPQLPISVCEIYELTGRKNKKFKRVYLEQHDMYEAGVMGKLPFHPDVIVTEDSGTGYQAYNALAETIGVDCISANGKSNIYRMLSTIVDKSVLVIADGAAFGAEIRDIVERQKLFPKKIGIFLPESFEWLILKSGLVSDPGWEKITAPERFVDSKQYSSWERYFTDLLVELTKDMKKYKRYPKRKGKLPAFYKQSKSIEKVIEAIPGVEFK
jgi:hypothetical protein